MSDVDPRSAVHPDHPTLAHDAWMWAVDGMIEGRENWTAEDEELGDLLENAICKVLCDRYGHQVEDDQCNKPEHRFCLWCRVSMSNQPVGKIATVPLSAAAPAHHTGGREEQRQ